jgi:hypothetical protein
MARTIGVLVAAPCLISTVLLGLGRAGRALRNHTRRNNP